MDYHIKLEVDALLLKKNSRSLIRSFFIKNIKGKDSLVLIAKDGKKSIGYIMCFVKEVPPVYVEDKMGYISDGYIVKGYRCKGIMTKMIKQAKLFFKKKKMKHIFLRANTRNKNGWNSWGKMGFKEGAKEMYLKL